VKDLLANFDKAFENKIRMGIMAALYVNDHLDFTSLKNLIGVTDVNLATRLKSLEKSNYVTFKKDFIDKKTNTKYFATLKGKQAFDLHIIAIEQLLNKKK
jgi:DNA-binding MarR family transcriptional regulator